MTKSNKTNILTQLLVKDVVHQNFEILSTMSQNNSCETNDAFDFSMQQKKKPFDMKTSFEFKDI